MKPKGRTPKPRFLDQKLSEDDRRYVHDAMVGVLVELRYDENNDYDTLEVVKQVVNS